MFSRFVNSLTPASVATATLLAMACIATVHAEVTLTNPEMELGQITAAGDTMPTGYGNSAVKVNGKVRMRMDFETFHSGEASMQIISDTTASGFWVGRLNGEDLADPGVYTLGGYAKYQDISRFQIGLVRYCGGGAYCQIQYLTAYRTSGTSLGWEPFEYDFQMVTEAECQQECTVRSPNVNYHVEVRGPGTVWLDSLYIIAPPPTGTTHRSTMAATASSAGPRVANRTVHFDEATTYRIAVLGPDGRIVSSTSGFGSEATVAPDGLATGAYLVRVTANGSTSTHMLAVQ